MSQLRLFTDASVCPDSGTGFGAYLVANEFDTFATITTPQIRLKRFDNTSSTRLELQTLIWALNDIETPVATIHVFTDCQAILSLPGRRERMETTDYTSQKGRRLTNADLYQQFYQIMDHRGCTFTKVRGHKSHALKDESDRIFALVDKAARKALREDKQ